MLIISSSYVKTLQSLTFHWGRSWEETDLNFLFEYYSLKYSDLLHFLCLIHFYLSFNFQTLFFLKYFELLFRLTAYSMHLGLTNWNKNQFMIKWIYLLVSLSSAYSILVNFSKVVSKLYAMARLSHHNFLCHSVQFGIKITYYIQAKIIKISRGPYSFLSQYAILNFIN
jgi:hypothetical protein